ncbi:MAG: prefoldin subunit alpha [Candidatus Bathyarchaeota archaeon]|nr:prefoldin subunit alpha [Candidatus Bathyarchaeota archaeon]
MAEKSDEEFRRLSLESRILEQRAEAIQSRINMVSAVIADLNYSSVTLEGLEKERENAELLIPIGGESYAKARLVTPDKVIVGIGAGVSVEKRLQEAKEIMKKRLEDLERTRAALQQQFVQVVDMINKNRESVERLISETREGKAQQNV